jgi:hypothetical protein
MTRYRAGRIAALFAVTIATTALSAPPGLAFSSEAQQMCSGDAMRLCSSEIPNIARITACMVRNRHHVSPGCRAVMEREAAVRRREAAAN